MRRFPALILAAALSLPVVVIAQQWTPPGADQDTAPESDTGDDSGSSVFERGMESFMQNMRKEAEPHLERLGRDLGDTVNSLRPVLGDIGALMDDVKNYQAPERLENGDILIRRRADAPPPRCSTIKRHSSSGLCITSLAQRMAIARQFRAWPSMWRCSMGIPVMRVTGVISSTATGSYT